MAYFFTVGEPALREKINWQAFMEVAAPEQSLIALGFWVTMVGAMAVLVLPFVAMLSIPQAAAAERL
ncbi:hypothetical protein HC928_23160 [bacterium]|nr:hypothetical protein [bacterium]